MAIFIILGVLISVAVAKSFTRPIISMVSVAEKIKRWRPNRNVLKSSRNLNLGVFKMPLMRWLIPLLI